jgi:hypothetical protein
MSCAAQYEFNAAGTAEMPISFKDALGAPVDVDAATESVDWMTVDGVAVDETAVLYGPAAITQVLAFPAVPVVGEYIVSFDPSSFTDGQIIAIGVSGDVAGTTLSATKTAIIEVTAIVPLALPTIC